MLTSGASDIDATHVASMLRCSASWPGREFRVNLDFSFCIALHLLTATELGIKRASNKKSCR